MSVNFTFDKKRNNKPKSPNKFSTPLNGQGPVGNKLWLVHLVLLVALLYMAKTLKGIDLIHQCHVEDIVFFTCVIKDVKGNQMKQYWIPNEPQ